MADLMQFSSLAVSNWAMNHADSMGASGCIIFSLCQEKERGATALDTGFPSLFFPPHSHSLLGALQCGHAVLCSCTEDILSTQIGDPDKHMQLQKLRVCWPKAISPSLRNDKVILTVRQFPSLCYNSLWDNRSYSISEIVNL